MTEIAMMIKSLDKELRRELSKSRSGVFRNKSGELVVQANVPFGRGYTDEVLGIFADVPDLEFFYKLYLNEND